MLEKRSRLPVGSNFNLISIMLTFVQPPKRKSSSKKPAKATTPTLIDGLTKEEMSKEQVRVKHLCVFESVQWCQEERKVASSRDISSSQYFTSIQLGWDPQETSFNKKGSNKCSTGWDILSCGSQHASSSKNTWYSRSNFSLELLCLL